MYRIKSSAKVEKQFDKEISQLSKEGKEEILKLLQTNPKKNRKKGQYYCHDLPEAHRILYTVIESEKFVHIHLAGDHNLYARFLNKNKRR